MAAVKNLEPLPLNTSLPANVPGLPSRPSDLVVPQFCYWHTGVLTNVLVFQTRSAIRSAMLFWTPTLSRTPMPKLHAVRIFSVQILHKLWCVRYRRADLLIWCLISVHLSFLHQKLLPRLGWSSWQVKLHHELWWITRRLFVTLSAKLDMTTLPRVCFISDFMCFSCKRLFFFFLYLLSCV